MSKRFSSKERAYLWSREKNHAQLNGLGDFPICNLCGLPVTPGQDWDESHDPGRARAFGGRATAIAHRRCNRDHGAKVVTPALAKAKRQQDFHIGATGPGLGKVPMRGGRRDRISRTMRHGVQQRLTHAEKHAAFIAARYGAFQIAPADGTEGEP